MSSSTCESCGREFPDYFRVCEFCGHRKSRKPTAGTNTTDSNKKADGAPARINKIIFALPIIIVFLFLLSKFGAGPNDRSGELDRTLARALIESTPIPERTNIENSERAIECLDSKGFIDAESGFLNNHGLDQNSPPGKGVYFRDFATHSGTIRLAPALRLKNVIITGIVDAGNHGPSGKIVEFTAVRDFDSTFDNSEVASCFPLDDEFQGMALAKKYDDGWRIEYPLGAD